MTTKRKPIKRNTRRAISPEMREKIRRLIELMADHRSAIEHDTEAFYADGRHAELCDLLPEVRSALGIPIWERPDDKLAEALKQ